MGMAYDVFGNGKTAVKANLSKYWQYAANDGVYIGTNQASTFAQTATRAWNDDNRNFTPDCDLNSRGGTGQPRDRRRFVRRRWTTQNFFAFATAARCAARPPWSAPVLLSGWGVRPFDWQFGASVQQQMLPRVSAEFGYSRRSWGNFDRSHRQPRRRAGGLRSPTRCTVPTRPATAERAASRCRTRC